MIKAFIFDWGGVLAFIDQTGFNHEISKKYSVSEELFSKAELENRLKFDAGEITPSQYITNLNKKLGIKINKKKYFDVFFSKYLKLNKNLINLVKQLKKKKYKLFLLSNTSPPSYKYIKKFTDFESIFDKMVLSFKEKMKKPNPLFYKKALEGTNIKLEECVYVEDRLDLILEAKKMGVNTIKYTTFNKFLKDLNSFSIKV